MTHEMPALALTALTIGVIHTILGPDHYLPFILMARAARWSKAKTQGVTLACGLAHVASSVLVGGVGILLGLALAGVESVESFRGELAAWALIGFGLVYLVWGLRRAARGRPHAHLHAHADGVVHSHPHTHAGAHLHAHSASDHERGPETMGRMTPWVLFTIFVLGPCEPLIPLLMYPAAQHSAAGVALVAVLYGAATLATMSVLVWALQSGLSHITLGGAERYAHALAGLTLLLCGLAIVALGI